MDPFMPTLRVKSASVLIDSGPDKITLNLDYPSTFVVYPDECAIARIEATKGTGIQWVRETLGLEPEVIDVGGRR